MEDNFTKRFKESMNKLNNEEIYILSSYYGVNPLNITLSINDISIILGIDKEKVVKKLCKALNKMKNDILK